MAKVVLNKAGIRAKLREGIAKGLNDSVIVLQRELVKELSKPGKGKLYKRSAGYGKRRNTREQGFHRASRPGDPPAADTGTLRRSWQAGPGGVVDRSKVRDSKTPRIRLGTKIKYASWLEYGTRRMGRRPYVAKPLGRAKRKVVEVIGRAIRRAFNTR